jgi:hypothetical protein
LEEGKVEKMEELKISNEEKEILEFQKGVQSS